MCLTDPYVAGALVRARVARKRALASAAAAATLALGLAACGDDSDTPQTTAVAVTTSTDVAPPSASASGNATGGPSTSGPDGDESTIEATLHAVLVGADPSQACVALVTERFVRTAYGDQSGCEQAQSKKAAADEIDVTGVAMVADGHGQAQVKAQGGVYDGQKLRAELVRDGETWRLDSLRSNVPVGP